MAGVIIADNFINGEYVPSKSGRYMDVRSPATEEIIGRVALSTVEDVAVAVAAAKAAFPAWSGLTVKARAAIMFKLHHLIEEHADELANLVVLENGKNKLEALASVSKANETVEWACSMPQIMQGKHQQVSRGITCSDERTPLGVVACVVPFNFPLMVPCWTLPIALASGNCVILKPSEKVPLTLRRLSELLTAAGVPPGVFQAVNGTAEVVTSLCDARDVSALTFVGSSYVAELVAQRCRAVNKRVLALGGAKNHLVALPDADIDMASSDIVASFAGCAGQRCMAASVLLLVGEEGDNRLLDAIVAKASALVPGQAAGQIGPLIDRASRERVSRYVTQAVEEHGATALLDGRSWLDRSPGHWFGPTVLLHARESDAALHEEIFGPVISVLRVRSWEHALAIENANEYGNAASIYTSNGANAEFFCARFRAGMLGVNIGVPVPREPFSFGGLYGTRSKFGDMDITGDGGLEFFTNRRKITSKWGRPGSVGDGRGTTAPGAAAASAAAAAAADTASFVGKM